MAFPGGNISAVRQFLKPCERQNTEGNCLCEFCASVLSFCHVSVFEQSEILFLVLVFEALCCTAEGFVPPHCVGTLVVLQTTGAAHPRGLHMDCVPN